MKKKVLVIKIGAIGDVIRSFALLEPLKEADITWVCGNISSPFVRSTKRVSVVIEVDEKKLFQGSFFQKIFEIFKVWLSLGFFKSFDQVLIAHNDYRYNIFSLFVRAKEKNKFSRKMKKIIPLPGRYFAHEYVRLANKNFLDLSSPLFPEIYVNESNFVKEFFAKNEKFKVVAIAPGGANNILNPDNLRRYPTQSYVELARDLISKGIKVIITGGKSDEWVAQYFQKIPVENFVGKTSLLELYSIYKRCDLVITHDCGPLHIATIAKTKVLGIFGPTDPRTVAGETFNSNVKIIFGGEKLPCSPCYDGKYFAKCINNRCMQSISKDVVLKEAFKILN